MTVTLLRGYAVSFDPTDFTWLVILLFKSVSLRDGCLHGLSLSSLRIEDKYPVKGTLSADKAL